MAYPRGFNSSKLRILDRFYHRFAHHFHAAYCNQLKRQTLHATKEQIGDDVFYDAIGGRGVHRHSLTITARREGREGRDSRDGKEKNGDYSWIDLDGSQLVPSAIAGIQADGAVTVFFIRIPESPEDALSMKKELTLSSVKEAMRSSIRWHPTSAHTLLVTDHNVLTLYQIERDFEAAKSVLTLRVDSSPDPTADMTLNTVNSDMTNNQNIKSIPEMITSYHYSFDGNLLVTLNGPQNKSYGLLSSLQQIEDTELQQRFCSELKHINFCRIFKFTKYEASDPRRVNAKHLDDITDYDTSPQCIATLDHKSMTEAVRKFDSMHGQDGVSTTTKGGYIEIFQHCIMLQPLSDAKMDRNLASQSLKNKMSYFFATASKCIGHALSCITLWAVVSNEDGDHGADHGANQDGYHPVVLQRILMQTASVNTVLTSMDYNRYSKPYLIVSSTTFDPFQEDYAESRRRYIEEKVLAKEVAVSAKPSKVDHYDSKEKPIIMIDFSGKIKENVHGNDVKDRNDTKDGDGNTTGNTTGNTDAMETLFHSHMISVDWTMNSNLSRMVPFVNGIFSKTDTSPSGLLIPCRSLYRFVEGSLIGSKPELKHLKLFTRRQTIGLLRAGVFAFKYFELYTPESIKLRRHHSHTSHAVQSREQRQQQLSDKLAINTQILKQRLRSKGNENETNIASKSVSDSTLLTRSPVTGPVGSSGSVVKSTDTNRSMKTMSTMPGGNVNVTGTLTADTLNTESSAVDTSRMASYLYAAPASNLNALKASPNMDCRDGLNEMKPDSGHSADTNGSDMEESGSNTQHRRKVKRSEQQFYSRLDKMLSQHHSTFLGNLDTKMERKLADYQQSINEKLASFAKQQQKTERLFKESMSEGKRGGKGSSSGSSMAVEQIEPVLTQIIADQIVPKLGVYMMQMFKNFCNNWIVPSIKEGIKDSMVNTSNTLTQQIEIKMKNIEISMKDIERKTASAVANGHVTSNGHGPTHSDPHQVSAILAESAHVQIANLVNKQLQETLDFIQKSLSNVMEQQLQKVLQQLQRELSGANSAMTSSLENQVSESLQQQFKSVMDGIKSVQSQQAALSAAVQTIQSLQSQHAPSQIHPISPTSKSRNSNHPNDAFERDRIHRHSSHPSHPTHPSHPSHSSHSSHRNHLESQSLPPYTQPPRRPLYGNGPSYPMHHERQQYRPHSLQPPSMYSQYDEVVSPPQDGNEMSSIQAQLAQLQRQLAKINNPVNGHMERHPDPRSTWSHLGHPPRGPPPSSRFAPHPPPDHLPAVQHRNTSPGLSHLLHSHPPEPVHGVNDGPSPFYPSYSGNHLYSELQGKISHLMSEYQDKLKSNVNDSGKVGVEAKSRRSRNLNVPHSHSHPPSSMISQISSDANSAANDSHHNGGLGAGSANGGGSASGSGTVETQQFEDGNQPFAAIEGALMNKNYSMLMVLFDKYDIGMLFENGFARDLAKNKCVVSFDLINQLLWVFADLMVDAPHRNEHGHIMADMVKVVEWMSMLMENVSSKDLDYDYNALAITLSKVENNMNRLSPADLRSKEASRSLKYLRLLVDKWKSK